MVKQDTVHERKARKNASSLTRVHKWVNKEQVHHKYDKDARALVEAFVYSADSRTGHKPLAVSLVDGVNSGKR